MPSPGATPASPLCWDNWDDSLPSRGDEPLWLPRLRSGRRSFPAPLAQLSLSPLPLPKKVNFLISSCAGVCFSPPMSGALGS